MKKFFSDWWACRSAPFLFLWVRFQGFVWSVHRWLVTTAEERERYDAEIATILDESAEKIDKSYNQKVEECVTEHKETFEGLTKRGNKND